MNIDTIVTFGKNYELVETDDEIICIPVISENGCQKYAHFISNSASKSVIRYIVENGKVTVRNIVKEITSLYGVSEDIILRDLDLVLSGLADKGVVFIDD